MKKRILFVTAIWMTVEMASVFATEVLGYIGIDGTPSAGQRRDYKRGSKFTMAGYGVTNSLCAFIDGAGGNTVNVQHWRVAVYNDNSGVPGNKLTESFETVQGPDSTRHSVCLGTAGAPLVPGDYWIVLHTGGKAGVIRYYTRPDINNWVGNNDLFDDGASTSFGAIEGPADGTVSAFVEYDAATEVAGRTTVGTNASGALRAQYKRGSPIDVTKSGQVTSINAYLDTLGGTSGTQDIRMALYRDAGGAPGQVVTDSPVQTLSSGNSAGWYKFPLNGPTPVMITPGRYWIMIHTGDNAGVIRYYADGTGNWYGNADAFADGVSNPFGPGGAGDGRVSAYVVIQ
jgi:hypothetical protein